MKFSTPDNDNDKGDIMLTVQLILTVDGWYHSCYHFNINTQPPSSIAGKILFIEMKMHPKDCIKEILYS